MAVDSNMSLLYAVSASIFISLNYFISVAIETEIGKYIPPIKYTGISTRPYSLSICDISVRLAIKVRTMGDHVKITALLYCPW
jgi:hypothetical protein